MIDGPAPSTNRICSSMGSLAWVEPTGVIHWIDDSFTHPTWAYMHLNPGFNRDDFIRLDDEAIDAQDDLLRSGWLRVSSMSSIEVEDPDTLDQRAWDAAFFLKPARSSLRIDLMRLRTRDSLIAMDQNLSCAFLLQ